MKSMKHILFFVFDKSYIVFLYPHSDNLIKEVFYPSKR